MQCYRASKCHKELDGKKATGVDGITKEEYRKLVGHYRYYGVTYNIPRLIKYHYYTTLLIYRWLNRRSQKKSYNWEEFKQMLDYYPLAYPKRYYNLYA